MWDRMMCWRSLLLSAALLAPLAMSDQARGDEATASRPPAEAPAGQPAELPGIQLQYQFPIEQEFHYDVSQEMTITTVKGTASQTAYNRTRINKHFRVISVDEDGNATLELTLDRVQVTVRFDQHDSQEFDSQSKEKPAKPFEAINESVGKPIARMVVSPTGKLIRTEAIQEEAGTPAKLPGDTDPSHNFLVMFPEHRLDVGESWSDTIEVPVRVTRSLSKPIRIRRSYTLESVKDDVATIKLETAILDRVQDGQMRAQLIQRAPKGTIRFNIATGSIVSREQAMDKIEIGVFGDDSSMRAVSKRNETLRPAAEVAGKPADTKTE